MSKKTKYSNSSLEDFGIKVIGFAMPTPTSKAARVIINIQTCVSLQLDLAIPRSKLGNPTIFKQYLLDKAFHVPGNTKILSDSEFWSWFAQELLEDINSQFKIVHRPGFYGSCYLTNDNKFVGIPGKKKPFLDPDSNLDSLIVGRKGSIEDWKKHVASSALYSSRYMLAICGALSSYIARLVNVESGGFHFYLTSSKGKTICLLVATSISGPNSSMCKWGTTSAAIEDDAIAHCDLALCIDGLEQIDNPKTVKEIIYKLASETMRGRYKSHQNPLMQNAQRWKVVIISSGEDSLSELAKSAGLERKLGELVRMPDVPFDAGKGLGCFDSLPKGISASDYVDKIKANTNRYYGTAHDLFIKELTTRMHENKPKLKKFIKAKMNIFLDGNHVDRNQGLEIRTANRFALAYAAGIIATKIGVLDFDERQIMGSISKCYQDSLGAPAASPIKPDEKGYREVEKLVNSEKLPDIRNSSRISHKDILRAKGCVTSVKGKTVIAIPTKVIDDLVGGIEIRQKVLTRFKVENRIYLESGKKPTRTVGLRRKDKKQTRCVCFKID